MTEFWRSNPNYWCELCRCWMADSKAARLNHERGMGHQENLKRKLRDMGRKADRDKREAAATETALDNVEAAAAKSYAKDLAEQRAVYGTWEWDEGAQYYYNTVQRWYYDPKTSWYYGGEPIAWTQSPTGLPAEARFGAAAHTGGPVQQGATTIAGEERALASAAGQSTARPETTGSLGKVQRIIHVPKHPLQDVGGHAMPSTGGRVGTGKGVGSTAAPEAGPPAAANTKRDREKGASGKAVSTEEAAALARREAAKQRVAARTLTTYGLS